MATVTSAPLGPPYVVKGALRFCPRCGADLRATGGYSKNSPIDEGMAIGVINCVACPALFQLYIQMRGNNGVKDEQA